MRRVQFRDQQLPNRSRGVKLSNDIRANRAHSQPNHYSSPTYAVLFLKISWLRIAPLSDVTVFSVPQRRRSCAIDICMSSAKADQVDRGLATLSVDVL